MLTYFIKTIRPEYISQLLDYAELYNQNQFYERQNFEKYLNKNDEKHPCIWYGIFEDNRLNALLVIKFGYPDASTALLAEVQTFIHGYGMPLIQEMLDEYPNIWWAVDNSHGYDDEEKLVEYYRTFGINEYYLDASKWVNGRHQYFFYRTEDEEHGKMIIGNIEKARTERMPVSTDKIRQIFDEVIFDYKQLFGVDLSYMQMKISKDNEYADGSPCYDYAPDEWAGTHTKMGYIIVNPDIHLCKDRYGLECADEEFVKQIIAHELAHEIWYSPYLVDDDFKLEILQKAENDDFNMVYLNTVSEDKLGEETFCEYLSNYIFINGSKLSLVSEIDKDREQASRVKNGNDRTH